MSNVTVSDSVRYECVFLSLSDNSSFRVFSHFSGELFPVARVSLSTSASYSPKNAKNGVCFAGQRTRTNRSLEGSRVCRA